MAHDHHHHHEADRNAWYLEQIFTIAVCGALGGVAVMLWSSGKLDLMLAPKFHLWVLLGGLTLLGLVLVRAVAVWRSVEEPHAHAHDHGHDHGHAHEHCEHGHCDHAHEHGIKTPAQVVGVGTAPLAAPPAVAPHTHTHEHDHGHDHSHGHDHGWAPWRYVILLLPVLLYFLNLPNQGFSSNYGDLMRDRLQGIDLTAVARDVRSTGTAEIDFLRLEQAALTPDQRDYYEGKTVALTGKYAGSDYKRFTLVRYKMNCCARDAIPLNAVIMVDPSSPEKLAPEKLDNRWVEVRGRVHFFNRPGTNEYLTALILYPTEEESLDKLVHVIPPPANQFLN